MEITVLIAAHNEAAQLNRTLRRLPTSVVPYVIANGCEDDTAQVAHNYGATTIELEQAGKLPALQEGIKALGRNAVSPFITLDADTRPLMPKRWPVAMLAARNECPVDGPAVATGPSVYFGDNDPIVSARWTLRHYEMQKHAQRDNSSAGFLGRNMLFDLHDSDTVEEMLSLPHLWYREDVAMKDVVLRHGGETFKSLAPGAAVLTSARRLNSIFDRFRLGKDQARTSFQGSYLADMPEGAHAYTTYEESVLEQAPALDSDI